MIICRRTHDKLSDPSASVLSRDEARPKIHHQENESPSASEHVHVFSESENLHYTAHTNYLREEPVPRQNLVCKSAIDSSDSWRQTHSRMVNSLLMAIRFLILVFSGHKQVALENIALRHQLAVFTREKRQPRLRNRDRLFWIGLKKLWKDWRAALVFVQPETVTGWQRKRFKRYWSRLSQSKRSGRPRVYFEIRKLVGTMAAANPIWGAPR